MSKLTNITEASDLVLGWANRNFQFCNEHSNLERAAFKNMNEWDVDISRDSDDVDVQTFYYILDRVKDCNHLFDFLDLKLEVENEVKRRMDSGELTE